MSDRNVEPAIGIGARESKVRQQPTSRLRFLRLLGPGIITGASDDDPSGIATYAVAGASLGYATLWTAFVTVPMMAVAQYISAKIGLVTGRGLAAVLKLHYPKYLLFPVVFALVIANSINAGADIGGIAAAINLLLPIRIVVLIVPIALAILALQIWASYKVIATIFKWLALALLAYIGAAVFARPDWGQVLVGTFVPHISFDAQYLTTLVAILGTTISPYMFFWQAAQEVEEDIEMGRRFLYQRKGTTDTELRYAAWDINVGMIFSNLVMYFTILATAATLHASGKVHIETAADAAKALVPLAGRGAEMLLAVGLIGAGFLAVPILTASSAYALSGAFGWKSGLSVRPGRAPRFYGIIIFSTLLGILINYVGIGPVQALYWTAVMYGFLTPILLAVIVMIGRNPKIMGDRANGWGLSLLGWLTAATMAAAAVLLIVFWGKT